ncbi:hypothetical protein NCCP1664_14870 [Zafaria cholistanensis]|uniref:CBU-0592-like domain-containing protein n=1 Tax=Zafaria cholistanensis TaxID=1682741 RepID=A0A5A7NTD0_9MICC|nr:hypothetical protein [Zafaria cholistanensis]GER22991.1 hypothetical protein NCCP1664_14870 [Zafaria cholistanensis]
MLAAVLGWMGMLGTFIAYAMLCRGRLTQESFMYAALNTAGGLVGGISCALYGAWPSVVSNVAWSLVGLHSLVRMYFQRHSAAAAVPPEADGCVQLDPKAGQGGRARIP